MQLELITPEKILFSAQIEMVVIPGTEGEFGVLAGHAPFVSTIREGVISVTLAGGERKEFSVSGGIAEVTPEKCVILANSTLNAAA